MSTGGTGQSFQNSFYVGNTFNAILYGVELTLYFQTIGLLYKGNGRHGSDKFFMCFSMVLLLCITVFVATQSIISEEMWVVNQNWPGGSSAYFLQYSSAWYETFGSTASILLQLMSDGLLTVWGGDWRVIVFPCILWIATLIFGILELYATGSPNTDFFAGFAAHVGLAYFAITISLNVITTFIICGRIMSYAKRTRKDLGDEFAETYFTSASIVVESALPYTLTGIAFLVAFEMESEFAVFLLSIYGMFTCISPQMLILRVAEGRAWTRNTASRHITALEFTHTSDLPGSSASAIGGEMSVPLPEGRGRNFEPDSSSSEKSTKTEV